MNYHISSQSVIGIKGSTDLGRLVCYVMNILHNKNPHCTFSSPQGLAGLDDGIHVFSVFLHTHLAGVSVVLRHIRNGTELPPIMADKSYDFNYQTTILLDQEVTVLPVRGWFDDVTHDDAIKWKHFPRYGPFVRRIHWSPVNSPHKSQWRRVLMFSLICVWINGWVNNREAGDLRRYRAHYDVIVMIAVTSLERRIIGWLDRL